MASWTQAACEPCYGAHFPGRVPVRLVERALERCCWCGHATFSGIYVRVDPATVPFPAADDLG